MPQAKPTQHESGISWSPETAIAPTSWPLDLANVPPRLSHLTDFLEHRHRLRGRWRRRLEKDGVLPFEDKRRRTEDVETGDSEGVVLSELPQQTAVFKITAKASNVETGVSSDLDENVLVSDVTLRFVPRLQEGEMKRVEGVVALGTGRLGGPESVEPPARVILRLCPDFPVVTFLAVDLLQTEIAPADGESVAELFLDLLQPDRCIVDERSEIVEVDFQ